jgi:hypothetical protein
MSGAFFVRRSSTATTQSRQEEGTRPKPAADEESTRDVIQGLYQTACCCHVWVCPAPITQAKQLLLAQKMLLLLLLAHQDAATQAASELSGRNCQFNVIKTHVHQCRTQRQR